MAASTRNDRVGAVETRGIEPVPDTERHGHAGQMFWTWFAANISHSGAAARRDPGQPSAA